MQQLVIIFPLTMLASTNIQNQIIIGASTDRQQNIIKVANKHYVPL